MKTKPKICVTCNGEKRVPDLDNGGTKPCPSCTQIKNNSQHTLTIPDGYAVLRVDLDADIPIIEINKDPFKDKDKKILEVPRALAYYLTTHHNGSKKFREQIRTDAQNHLRSMLKDLLEKKDYSVSPYGRNM
jgi:hypothetical protein